MGPLCQGKIGQMVEVEPSDQLVHRLKKAAAVHVPMVQGVHTGNVVMVDTNLVAVGILREASSGTVVMSQMNQVVCMDFEVMARTNRVVSMGFEVMARTNLAVGSTLHREVDKGLVATALTIFLGEIPVVCIGLCEGLQLGYAGLVEGVVYWEECVRRLGILPWHNQRGEQQQQHTELVFAVPLPLGCSYIWCLKPLDSWVGPM